MKRWIISFFDVDAGCQDWKYVIADSISEAKKEFLFSVDGEGHYHHESEGWLR